MERSAALDVHVKQHELYSVVSAWISLLFLPGCGHLARDVQICDKQTHCLVYMLLMEMQSACWPLTARELTHPAIQNYCPWTATYWNFVILIWDRNKLYKAITLHTQIFISNQLENICLVTFNLVQSSNTYFSISYSRNSETNLTIFTTFVYALHMRSNINVLPCSINSAHVNVFLQFIQLQSVQ